MPLEDAADRAAFFDAEEHGTTAVYRSTAALPPVPPAAVTGVFDREYLAVDVGAGVEVASARPTFILPADLLPAVVVGDTLTIGDEVWRIAVVRPDGTGMVTLDLELVA